MPEPAPVTSATLSLSFMSDLLAETHPASRPPRPRRSRERARPSSAATRIPATRARPPAARVAGALLPLVGRRPPDRAPGERRDLLLVHAVVARGDDHDGRTVDGEHERLGDLRDLHPQGIRRLLRRARVHVELDHLAGEPGGDDRGLNLLGGGLHRWIRAPAPPSRARRPASVPPR